MVAPLDATLSPDLPDTPYIFRPGQWQLNQFMPALVGGSQFGFVRVAVQL